MRTLALVVALLSSVALADPPNAMGSRARLMGGNVGTFTNMVLGTAGRWHMDPAGNDIQITDNGTLYYTWNDVTGRLQSVYGFGVGIAEGAGSWQPDGLHLVLRTTTSSYYESTGGATSTAYASASGQYWCLNTNATCTANFRETGGAITMNGTGGLFLTAAGGAAGNIALTGSVSVAVGKPLYFTAGLTAGYIVGDATGGVAIPTSNSAVVVANLGGSLSVNTTGVGNVGVSGPDDLQTYSLPANAILVTGRGVRIHAYGTTLNNANVKTVALNWGGQVLIAKALAPSIAGFWSIDATCFRTGASTQDCMAVADNHGGTTMSPTDGATTVRLAALTAGTQTETAIIVVKTTSTASTTNNDIISEGLTVEFF